MQSLKSTAFAITLLAVSFGLYCFSDTEKQSDVEQDLMDTIQIEDGVAQVLPAIKQPPKKEPFKKASFAEEIAKRNNPKAAQRQSSMPVIAPRERVQNPPSTGRYELASAPKLPPPIKPVSAPKFIPKTQPKLPPLSSNRELNLPGIDLKPPAREELELLSPPDTLPDLTPPQSGSGDFVAMKTAPEAAIRQPVQPSASERDGGLIDALKQDFAARPIESNTPSTTYNSLASAVSPSSAVEEVSNASEFQSQPTPPSATQPKPANQSEAIWSQAEQLVEQNELRQALGLLSRFYRSNEMPGPQQQKLLGWLDGLAGKVIYSPEHRFIAQPYIVKQGDSLAALASQWRIPTEVIYNINRAAFAGATEVQPGMQLKVVNGPFNAEVSLKEKMMTLYVKNLYAGRFPVAVGISGKPSPGNYQVMVKSPQGYTWRDANGNEYPPGHPQNGYGQFWIGLSGSLCLHSVPGGTPHGHSGCVGLSMQDAKDIFGMLSKDSQVTITP